jgi:acetyl esterase
VAIHLRSFLDCRSRYGSFAMTNRECSCAGESGPAGRPSKSPAPATSISDPRLTLPPTRHAFGLLMPLRFLPRIAAAALMVFVCSGVSFSIGHAAQPSTEQLQQRLKKFPEADANGDGILTEEEARAHQKKLKQSKPTKSTEAEAPPVDARPTFADIAYGPHARNQLDLWRAKSEQPAPVLIFFHGGSFKAGDKSMIVQRPILGECLQAGIAVVSANYRFSSDAPFPAPMHDGARAVQFVRSMAKSWNIDPARIAVSGSSAGATLALWIALHDDLANPASADPVARLSTRVMCATPHSGTAGLEPEYFQKHAGVTKLGAALWQLFGAATQAELLTPEKRSLTREASPLQHASADDPPLFLTYAGDPAEAPFSASSAQNAWIHHVCLGLPLKARYDTLGVPCEIYYHSKPAPAGAEIVFLKRHLLRSVPTKL